MIGESKFLETGDCDRVRVSITGLQGEDLAGMLMNINLDPNIPAIDEQATESSFQNFLVLRLPTSGNQFDRLMEIK